MKNYIVIIGLSLTSTLFAGDISSTKAEKKLLCDAVEAYLEKESFDIALDYESCIVNKQITSQKTTKGLILLDGVLKFSSPQRSSVHLSCGLIYHTKPVIKNIFGGIDSVVCE